MGVKNRLVDLFDSLGIVFENKKPAGNSTGHRQGVGNEGNRIGDGLSRAHSISHSLPIEPIAGWFTTLNHVKSI